MEAYKNYKAPTDELSDIGRKLDVGVEYLRILAEGQDGLLKGQDRVVELLQKIAEK